MPGKDEKAKGVGGRARARPRPPDYLIVARVTAITKMLDAGRNLEGIRQKIAEQVKIELTEAQKVARAREAALASGDEAAVWAIEDPPTVWGGVEPPTRTLGLYTKKAREILEAEGRQLGRLGNYILGSQWRRGLALYERAWDEGNLTVAQRVWDGLNAMWGLQKLKIDISALAPPADTPAGEVMETELTHEQAIDELAAIRARAIDRARAAGQKKLAAAEPVEITEQAAGA